MLPICLIGLHNPRLLVACSLGNLFPKQKGGLYICCKLSSWPRTAELFPLRSALPQVTTDPSSGMAAKAWTVAQSAARPSAHLDLPNCHRQSLNYPSSRRIHLPESQQRPHLWPEPAAPSWDDIELQNRHRQGLHYVRPESAAQTPDLVSDCRTVAAKACITPAHDRSIFQNGSKGPICGLNLLHTPEFISDFRTVTPGNSCAIPLTPHGKCRYCCCRLWLKYQSSKALSVLYLCFF